MTNGPAGVGPGGAGSQKPATAMPAPVALAATWDPELARVYGKLEAEETRSLAVRSSNRPTLTSRACPGRPRLRELRRGPLARRPYRRGRH